MRRLSLQNVPDIAASAAVFGMLGVSFGSSNAGLACAVVVGAVLGAVGLDAVRFVKSVTLAVGLCSVINLVFTRATPSYQIDGLVLTLLFVCVLVATYVYWIYLGPAQTPPWLLIGPSLAISWAFWTMRTLDSAQSLARVAGDYAEDNGAWLLALARSTTSDSTVLNFASGTSGGPSTGWVLASIRSLSQWFSGSGVSGLADNATVLLRAYLVVAAIGGLLLSVIVAELSSDHQGRTRIWGPTVCAAVSLPFFVALIKVGHFSAMVAVLAVETAVLAAVQASRSTVKRFVSILWVALALVAAGQAWYPLTGVAALFVVLMGIDWLRNSHVSTDQLGTRKQKVFVAIVTLLLLAVIFSRVFSTYAGNIRDLDYVLANLRMVGGYATVNPILVLSSIVSVLTYCSIRWDQLRVAAHAVTALLLPLASLLLVSYAMEPNTPQYGVLKYAFILVSVFVPLTVGVATSVLVMRSDRQLAFLVSAMMTIAVMMFPPPSSDIKWIWNHGANTNEWSSAVVDGVNKGRTVVCLNTLEGDTGRNYEAYLCTRIATALAGVDTYESRTWTAANICQIPIKQARAAFTHEFQKSLTIVIFDRSRLTSDAGCQTGEAGEPGGWTAVVDWSLVEIVGPDGSLVHPADIPEFADT